MRRTLAIAGLAILTSGCATYSWYRADTPPELAARDQAECYDLARDSARDIAFSAFPRLYGAPRPWPTLGWPGWSDPYWGPGGDPLWRMDVEQRIHERCMRSRGYDLQRESNAMGGPEMAPRTPQPSERPGEAVSLLSVPRGS